MESLSIQFQPFFDWLLRTTLQASLLICLILLLQAVLRSRLGIRWHYCLWLLLLVRMAMPWTPASRVSLFNLLPQSMPQRQLEHAKGQIAEDSADSIAASANTSESTQVSTTTVAQAEPEATSITPQTSKEAGAQMKSMLFEFAAVLPLVWLVGALVLAVYICASNLNFLRIVRLRRPVTDQKILDLLEDCKSQMGIRTILGIVTTDKVKSPALFGFLRPRLLLPEGMIETLDQQELRYILLHELAHLKRHDIYIGWLISLLQVLHWFNPLIWLAFYRMRSDRELACDALVMARTQSDEPKSYGRIIVNLVERFSRPQRLPGMAGILETKAHLKRRITMIARFKKNSYQWSPLAVILTVILACVSLPDAKRTKASGISAAKPSAIVVRRAWAEAPNPFYIGAPSPDGKYLAYSDWDGLIDGGPPLAVLELATGKTRHLTKTGSWSPLYPIFSPDSKQVAYAWHNPENKVMELRIVGLDGSEPRVLHSDREVQVFRPADWSADGQHILAFLANKEWQTQIALVNVSDGTIRVVKTFDTFDTTSMLKLSPDGRYIAYSHPSAEGSSKADIFLLTTDVTRETTLVEHPADDCVLGWAPDGKRLVFTSDRTGSIGIWVIGVADGKPQGTPELVKPQMGKFYPLGFTRNGSLYYAVSTGRSDVHIATLDPETGKLLGQSVKAIQRFEGYNSAPEWSPDGRYLVCQSRRAGAGGPSLTNVVLIIRELESGKVRILEPEYKSLNPRSLRWSPDGQSILGTGRDNRGRKGLLQIDVQTEAVTALAYKDPKRGGGILEPAWAPNGKAVFYVRDHVGDSNSTEPRRIVRRELATGEETELCRIPGRVQWLAPSPDGRHLAFYTGSAVKLVSVTGGQPRKLTEADDNCGITWTPDGRYLLFGRKIDDEAKLDLWRIPAQGGEPQKTGLTFDGWNVDVRMHPDGRRIAFASKQVDKNEVWAMENFLPGVAAAKPDTGPAGDAQQTGLVVREVKIEQGEYGLSLSRDGKKLVYPKRKKGKTNLVVRDLASGKETQITNYETGTARYPVFSPDGKEVAYTRTNQLHIVSLETGEDRRLDQDGFAIDWSRDGRFLLLNGNRVLPVGEGSIKKLNLPSPARAGGFSPDGKYVTYVSPRGKPKIYLYPVSGGDPIQITHGSRGRNLIWSPNGKVLLFLSQRAFGPEMDLCGVSVVDGKAAGDVQVIKPDFGDKIRLISLSETGRLLFRRFHTESPIYVTPIDPQTGQPSGNPVRLADGCWAMWSPDGKRIAYFSSGWDLHVMSADGSNGQKIIGVSPFIGTHAWAADNKHIYVAESSRVAERKGIYSISIAAKERRPVFLDPDMIGHVTCSPDGKRLAFLKLPASSKKDEIFTVNVDGTNLRQLTFDDDAGVLYPAWSPDGKQIAFESGPGGGIKTLTVVSVDDGTSREIFRGKTPQDRFFEASWSPDGSKIAWQTYTLGGIRIGKVSDEKYDEFKVDLGTLTKPELKTPRWSPDSTKILFSAYSNVENLMLMDNFLPTTVASAAK